MKYAPFQHVHNTLEGYGKTNMLITELKSDALNERHWKTLMRQLRVNWILSDLTLGQVWDVDLQRNDAVVRDVILAAKGEMDLEVILKQVRHSWKNYKLDMTEHNKCPLIRRWNDLFNKVNEDTNSLAALKRSPYYKVVEKKAAALEGNIYRIKSLFDVWVYVQRRWVYLEGIFRGSADIKGFLSAVTSRFQSISSKFLILMKEVSKSPMVVDVLNIAGVQQSLEDLERRFVEIKKELGEYLETQRASFPRFYFVTMKIF